MKKLFVLLLVILSLLIAATALASPITISISYDRLFFTDNSPVTVSYNITGGSGTYYINYWMNGYNSYTNQPERYFGESQWNARTKDAGPSRKTITYVPSGYTEIYFNIELYDTNGEYANQAGDILYVLAGSSSGSGGTGSSSCSGDSTDSSDQWICPKCCTLASDRYCYNCGYDYWGSEVQESGTQSNGYQGSQNQSSGVQNSAVSGSYTVGSTIRFGKYRQFVSSSYLQPLEWLVLETDPANDRMLVVNKYAIDCVQYNGGSKAGSNWESCYLRTWLNGSFLYNAFSAEERSDILQTWVDNSAWQSWKGKIGCSATCDWLFLLSYQEVMRYMPNDTGRQCAPTSVAVRNGVSSNKNYKAEGYYDGTCSWWLRTNGDSLTDIDTIPASGDGTGWTTDYNRYAEAASHKGVRPAMWVRMSSGYVTR